jgi:hypothetical protein
MVSMPLALLVLAPSASAATSPRVDDRQADLTLITVTQSMVTTWPAQPVRVPSPAEAVAK